MSWPQQFGEPITNRPTFLISSFPKQAKDRERIIVGRLVVAVLVGVSLCWLPIVKGEIVYSFRTNNQVTIHLFSV